MKAVVVREISALILRPTRSGASAATTTTGATHLKFGDDSKPKSKPKELDAKVKKDLQQEHAKYYGTITLNQIMLASTEADRSVAIQLINMYFELFKEILGQSGKSDADNPESELDHTRAGKEKRKKMEQKKGKGKEKQTSHTQYPLVLLLNLLDRHSLLKTPSILESLVSLLDTVTRPLTSLKDPHEVVEAKPESTTAAPAGEAPASANVASADTSADTGTQVPQEAPPAQGEPLL